MADCHRLEELQSEKQSAFETTQGMVLKSCVWSRQRLQAVQIHPASTVAESHDLSPLGLLCFAMTTAYLR